MSIQYAIEIFTGSAITSADMGITSGTFRFITGSPGYDGTTPYPLWEDWSPNSNVWYEGFIVKEGLSNPSRQVDISISGDYGVLSGFNFKIRNTDLFWNFVKANNIYLVNKTVKLYTVISDTFFQVWQGVVSNNPYDELNYQFQCNDDFRTIHGYLPPEVITKTNYEDATTDLSQTIPVALGDIPYAKLMKIENIERQFKTLVYGNFRSTGLKSHDTCAAISYHTELSADGYCALVLFTYGVNFAENDLNDTFLVAVSGENAETDKIIRILYNSATSISPKGHNYTTIVLSEPLQTTTQSTFNDVANHQKYDDSNPTADANWVGSTTDTWWFKIFSLNVVTKLSNNSIYAFEKLNGSIQLYAWDEKLKRFIDIKDLVSYDSVTGEVKLLANNVNEEGEVVVTSRIPCSIKKATYDIKRSTTGGFQSGTSHVSIPDSYLTTLADGSRTSGYYEISGLTNVNTNPKKVAVRLIIDPATISEFGNYDDIYIGMDFTIINPKSFTTHIEVACRDVYGWRLSDPYTIEEQIYSARTCAIPTTMNFLSNEYYKNTGNSIATDSGSLFGQIKTIEGSDVPVYSKLALPSDLVTALKSKSITELDIRFYISQADPDITGLNIKVKEFGFLGSRTVATITGDIYTKIKGETTHGEQTNNVYNAFRHILEDYDGLTDSQIDYGNLETARRPWHLGRQIIERQSSFDYIQELCKTSFVCMFPTRTGKRGFSVWREDTSTPVTHDETTIVRDSISNYSKTKIQDLFNEFNIKYNYNPASDKFERAFFIDYVEESSFPLATNESWKKYFGGLENDSYQEAKALWEICHESYLRANALSSKVPDNLTKLFFYIDVNTFSSDSSYNIYKGTKSSAYLFLKNLVEWTSRQKDNVSYSIPMNSVNIKSELLNPIIFNDAIYSNSVDRTGWITKVELDTQKDQLKITSTLEPYDIITIEDDLIVETGSATTTITESGIQPDTITET